VVGGAAACDSQVKIVSVVKVEDRALLDDR